MNEGRWIRIASAVLFLTGGAVFLGGRIAAGSGTITTLLGTWLLVMAVVLTAIFVLPLRDDVDRTIHHLATGFGFVALLVWLDSYPTYSTIGLVLVVFAGIVVSWGSIARQRWSEERDGAVGARDGAMTARLRVVGVIAIVAAASLLYRWLVWHRLEQTSALFIGIPAFLAALVALLSRPKTATGMICTVTAIALLVSGVFLGEGFICILMASPLFFLIAVIVGSATDWARKREKRSQTLIGCVLLLTLTPMSFEGTGARLSFPREEIVRREFVVQASPAEVAARIAKRPQFNGELPAYLRLGFPRPTETSGSGIQIGDLRKIHFAGGEGKPGDLVMEVVTADYHSVEFREVSDTSHVAHWLRWESTRFEWTSLPEGQTRVTCTVRYRRLLDPAWYFKPWERYAVELSTEYLLHSLVEPGARR